MKELNKMELMSINGGFISFGKALAIIGAFTFIVGVIDGFVRPLKCN